MGIILIVDSAGRLLGPITDGDIRRAVIAGSPMTTTAADLLSQKGAGGPPITAPAGSSHSELVALLRRTQVSHVPLVDSDSRVVGLVTLQDLLEEDEEALHAVVMAGGRGSRLMPLTADTPKPLLPVGGTPVMERIIRQLSDSGIRQVSVTTHYQAEKIERHFGQGERFGVNLSYVLEDEMLGTAGGLALMDRPSNTLLVINGDILTELNFRAMLAFHREQHAALTLAVREYEFQIPYGVIEAEGPRVERIVEKPVHKVYVSAGIYLMEPTVHALIPKGSHFDMPDLIRAAVASGETVVKFPVWEYWRDIGQRSDYEKAQTDVQGGVLTRTDVRDET